MKGTWLSQEANGKALENFFDRSRGRGHTIESIIIWKDGHVVAKAAPAPYDTEDRAEVYSLSKAFCATAIGILIDEGRLTLDTKIADVFPKAAEGGDEELRQATVEDLLTMRTGHTACVMPALSRAFDPPRAFFTQKTDYPHGSHFAYNTGSTYMLSAVLQKITGMTVMDYLEPRLFQPLGIQGAWWNRCAGVSEGGVGLHVSAEDILKFCIMYLNEGVYEGKRIVSADWVRNARAAHADNSMNGTPDWCAGYGFQLWLNASGGYRCDGAFGQFGIVLSEKKTVAAVRAMVDDMQSELEDILRLVDEISEGSTPADIPDYEPLACEGDISPFEGLYRCAANPFGWTQIRLGRADTALCVTIGDGAREQRILCGNGKWIDGTLWAKRYCPKLVGLQDNLYTEEISFASSYTMRDGMIDIECRYRTNPHTEHILLSLEGGSLHVKWSLKELRAEGAAALSAVRM